MTDRDMISECARRRECARLYRETGGIQCMLVAPRECDKDVITS